MATMASATRISISVSRLALHARLARITVNGRRPSVASAGFAPDAGDGARLPAGR